MARLLAAERQAAREHLLHDVLVADRRAHESDAGAAQRELEADVAHHRRHDASPFSRPSRCSWRRAHQQHGVAVDDPAAVIDENRAIAVAVERHAQPAAASTTVRPARSGCVDPQPRLMLRPSGRSPMTVTSKPEALEQTAAPPSSWRRWRSRSRARSPRARPASGSTARR